MDFEGVWAEIRQRLILDSKRMYSNPEDAEDAISEVCLRLLQRYSDKPRGEMWLLARAMLFNSFCDHVRTTSRRRELLSRHVSQMRAPRDRSFDLASSRLDLENVATDSQLRAVAMVMSGYSHREIAEACGVSRSTVNVWLWKLRSKLSEGDCDDVQDSRDG